MKRLKLKLFGLACAGCINAVKNALERAGAKVEKIDLNEAEIIVKENNIEKYVEVVRKAGYDAKVVEEL
jgi:Cu+-exporting ATPase